MSQRIRLMSGNGLMTHAHERGGDVRDRSRAFVRNRYAEGVQFAYRYYEEPGEVRRQLARLWAFMHEEDEIDAPPQRNP